MTTFEERVALVKSLTPDDAKEILARLAGYNPVVFDGVTASAPGSDTQPDPYIDRMAGEHVQEFEAERCLHCGGCGAIRAGGYPEDAECPVCGGRGQIVPPQTQ